MTRSSAGSVAAVVVVLGLLLVVAYIGAIGPVVWLNDRGLLDLDQRSPISWIYYPLEVAADNCQPVDSALSWYIALWESRPAWPQSLPSTPYCPPVASPAGMPVPAGPVPAGMPVPVPAPPGGATLPPPGSGYAY